MPLDKDTDYEFVEVKVSHKIDVKLSVDDLLNALQQQLDAAAASKQATSAQLTDRLNQLNQLAGQLKVDLSKLGQPTP